MKLHHLLAPIVLAAPALAGTWIVDDDGGPGVDFTDIQPAIDAASPGDVILVLGGTYSGFTLGTALTIVGQPGATAQGDAILANIQDGPYAAVAGLVVRDLDVSGCSATVVLDEVRLAGTHPQAPLSITFDSSKDVRARDLVRTTSFSSSTLSLACTGGRLELLDSGLSGEDGVNCPSSAFGCSLGGGCTPTPGEHAVVMDGGATLHAYRTSIEGGLFGFECQGFPYHPAGSAAVVFSGSLLLAGQDEHEVAPGWTSANAISLGSVAGLRHSGVDLIGSIGAPAGSTVEAPAQADPTLHILGPVASGEVLTYRVNAPQGSSVVLNLGRFPDLVPVGGLEEDILVKTVRTFQLGTVGGGGVVGFNFTVPSYLTTGFTFFAQARVVLPGGATRYTNSVPVVLR